MKKKIKTGLALLLFIAAICEYAFILINALTVSRYTSFSLSDIPEKDKRLMIVAHPDDESLFGGSMLLADDYLVVVVTAGGNTARAEELTQLVRETGDDCIMLGYPDKTFFKRDNWSGCRDRILADLSAIIDCREWEMIVTHNPDGEYGHNHHKMTSALVTEVCANAKISDRLYYFAPYHKLTDLTGLTETVDAGTVQTLRDLLYQVYRTQKSTLDKLIHTVPYQHPVAFADWQY